ncbi:hypothetical protein [uncultured Microbacterium sp.]|uniref:hypothetical protein n=1 Tax=uncultured Microbacterium sp. TaxID=191216 RepID=UPI0028D8022C|nr:hypothetical protein [uncultured Microbacterium sp.]
MTDDEPVSFDILYAFGRSVNPVVLRFSGRSDDLARTRIGDALRHLSRPSEADGNDFKLSPRAAFDGAEEDTLFLHLTGEETLAQLRTIVGPDDSAVVLRQGGWGDSSGTEVLNWVVSDFLPFSRTMLEVYGAVEVMRTAGRAIESRRNRETLREAKYWALSGNSEVYGLLRSQVDSMHSWTAQQVKSQFGLELHDAGRLMAACGYEFDRSDETFYRRRQPGS